jgi:hypothetical protein
MAEWMRLARLATGILAGSIALVAFGLDNAIEGLRASLSVVVHRGTDDLADR